MFSCLTGGGAARTLGYYEPGDGGGAIYNIVDDEYLIDDGGSVHDLDNGLKAKLVIDNNTILAEQYGAYGDGIHDDKQVLRTMFYNCKALFYLLTKTYKTTGSLDLNVVPSGATITGGGTIFMPSSVSRKSIIQIFNRNEKITIDNLIFKSIADQTPQVPDGHTARVGAVSSNLNALRIEKCNNLILTNLTFINMAYDASIRGLLYDGTFGCNHIFIENWYDENGQMGIYGDSIDDIYINNYVMKPDPIAMGGVHILYTAEAIGKARYNNITLYGNNTTDVAFDFAGFNGRTDINYNADIIVDGFNITANGLIGVKRSCKNITIKNGTFTMLNKKTEGGSIVSYGALAAYVDSNDNNISVYPTINIENVTLIHDNSNELNNYIYNTYDSNFGIYKLKNCNIINLSAQDMNVAYRGCLELDSCYIYNDVDTGIYKSFITTQNPYNFDTYCKMHNCRIDFLASNYPFNNINENCTLEIKNNIINRSQGSSLIFNANKTAGDMIVSGNDYYGTNVTTSTIMLSGVSGGNVIQYNNYCAGQLYVLN